MLASIWKKVAKIHKYMSMPVNFPQKRYVDSVYQVSKILRLTEKFENRNINKRLTDKHEYKIYRKIWMKDLKILKNKENIKI